MELKTERLLSTLEILLEKESFLLPYHEGSVTVKPYVWDATTQGTFTPLRVIQSEGWITLTDPEVAVTNWQWSEHSGLAAKSILDTDPSCLSGDDTENILLDDAVKSKRTEKYQALLELLKASIENLQAFTLSCIPGYSLSIIVGQITEQRWICLSPNVPQETPKYVRDEIKCSVYTDVETHPKEEMSAIEIQIQAVLEKLSRIKVYGWYDGGYDRVHD